MTTEIMRNILLAYLLGISAVAILFLRTRALSVAAYIGWGLVAILVPLAGPFAVLFFRPGSRLPQGRK